MRILTSIIWVFITMAFGFEAMASPCDLRMQTEIEVEHVHHEAMPCHDGMEMPASSNPEEAPEHHSETCCCAALLTNISLIEAAELDQPLPGIMAWTIPLPDHAASIPFEYDPPPPRI